VVIEQKVVQDQHIIGQKGEDEMGYMHIDNLYKNQDILLFKECYASEKIHGTSAHISWKDSKVSFFSGGVEYLNFINLFNVNILTDKFIELDRPEIVVYGEAYGGKCQRMSQTYGKDLKFVAFEVRIVDTWLCVLDAESVSVSLGLDFVPYLKSSTNLEDLDAQRDAPSIQSMKCGIDGPKKREGIVLKPLIELRKNNGARIISKHKNEDFMETRTPRKVDGKDLEILKQANAIAEEWITEMRLSHVLDNFPNPAIENTGEIIKAMIGDVERESEGEIIKSRKARKAMSKRTAIMFKERLKERLYK